MDRFILRYTGREATGKCLEQIRAAKGIRVVEEASPRMLLVEGEGESVRRLAESLPGWTYTPEQQIPLPDPRPKIRRR
jgi:hypothetical protein